MIGSILRRVVSCRHKTLFPETREETQPIAGLVSFKLSLSVTQTVLSHCDKKPGAPKGVGRTVSWLERSRRQTDRPEKRSGAEQTTAGSRGQNEGTLKTIAPYYAQMASFFRGREAHSER